MGGSGSAGIFGLSASSGPTVVSSISALDSNMQGGKAERRVLPSCLARITSRGDVDLDRPRFRFLTQREPHGEDAVLVLGRDPAGVDGLRQRERAAERTVAPLGVVVLLVLHLARGPLLALDGQHEVLDVDLDVVA